MKKLSAADVSSGQMIEVYAASDVEALVQILRGALADIATSDDMTLEIARAKAKRIYDETANGL